MKKIHLIYAACLLVGMGACAASVQKQVKDNFDVWKEYNTGAILFEDKHRKRWDRTFTTGLFPMLNRTSRNRHVLY